MTRAIHFRKFTGATSQVLTFVSTSVVACHLVVAPASKHIGMVNLRCERFGPFDLEELKEELANLEFEYMMDLAPSKPPTVVRLCECKEAYAPEADEVRAFVTEYSDALRQTPAWRADRAGASKALYEGWLREHGRQGRLFFHRPRGCERCRDTGYRGRIGLHELLVADDAVRRLIQERARVSEIFETGVRHGMRTLKMDGMEKILLGLTDLSQVRAVCMR